MQSEAQKRACAKYQRANTTQVILRLNKRTDADVIERLNACGNKQGYIKSLIRADIERGE